MNLPQIIDHPFDWLRAVNVILSFVCIVLMAHRMDLMRMLPSSWRLVAMGTGAYVMSGLVVSIEALLGHTPPGLRVPLTTVSLVWLIVGLLRVNADITRGSKDVGE